MSIVRKLSSALRTFGTRGTHHSRRRPVRRRGGSSESQAVRHAARALKKRL